MLYSVAGKLQSFLCGQNLPRTLPLRVSDRNTRAFLLSLFSVYVVVVEQQTTTNWKEQMKQQSRKQKRTKNKVKKFETERARTLNQKPLWK